MPASDDARGIDPEVLVAALKRAILIGARHHYGADWRFDARFAQEVGEVELWRIREVVVEPAGSHQVALSDARDLDDTSEVGDEVEELLATPFGRPAAQLAKALILCAMEGRSAPRDEELRDLYLRFAAEPPPEPTST